MKKTHRGKVLWFGLHVAGGLSIVLGSSGTGCEHDMQVAFRETSTAPIGEGVKTFLAGNPEQGFGQIVSSGIDGLVAGIQQVGKPGTSSTTTSTKSINH